MTFNPERGGPEQFEEEDVIGVGPATWEKLAEEGGGVQRMKKRVSEARRGIRLDSRRERERSPQFANLLEASAVGAAIVNERRSRRE